MTDFLQLLVFMIAALNPAAAAAAPVPPGKRLGWDVIGGGTGIALVVCVSAAVFGDRILDGLDVEPETFRVGAGAVMLVTGGLALWNGGAPHRGPWEGRGAALFPLALPVLVTPAVLVASLSYGADRGAGETSMAIVVAMLLGAGLLAVRFGRFEAASDGVARVTGALLVVVAAGLIVDGVRAI